MNEYIIKSSQQDLSLVFDLFGGYGYHFIDNYLSTRLIKYQFNNKIIQANIYKLTQDGKIEDIPIEKPIVKNKYIPSERLKVMLLLAVSQLYKIKENEIKKVILIEPKWLGNYNYEDIMSLVYNAYQKIDPNKAFQFWNGNYDLNSLSTIISLIKEDKLKALEEKVKTETKIPFFSQPELVDIQGKYLPLYKKFALANEHMFKFFQKYFSIQNYKHDIQYYKKEKEGQLIILENYPFSVQNNGIVNNNVNIILYGISETKEYKFHIYYIFDFPSKELLNSEIKVMINYGINSYLYDRTVMNHQDKKDIISPIFLNDEIIGNCYKYTHDDYNKYINYMMYCYNVQLKNVLYLYINEKSIKSKMKKPNKDDEYYLINKPFLTDFKQKNDYEKLKNVFKGKIKSIPQNKKEIYSIIKSIPKNDLEQFSSNNINFNSANTTALVIKKANRLPEIDTEIPIIPIANPINPIESYMILKDFEIVEKYIAKVLFNDTINYHILKCTFVGDDRIIFHYPINKYGNKKYMCLISRIDESNNFINEFL